MEWLKATGSLISLRSLTAGPQSGRNVAITFDDAFDNVRQNALPVLADLQIPATVFAVAGCLGKTPNWTMDGNHPDRGEVLSTAAQLRAYPPELIDIGSHTVSHPDLTKTGDQQVDRELRESKSILEEAIGREVWCLSVPYGAYHSGTLNAAKSVGYSMVVTCDPRVVDPETDSFCIGRFKVTPDDWPIEFRLKAIGAHAWRDAWQRIASTRSSYERSTNSSGPPHSAKAIP